MTHLDRNENQLGPAPECYEILRRATRQELSEYSRDYLRGVKSVLSEAIALEVGLRESEVLLSYGSEDMLKQIVHCYLGAGESMMIPRYSWWYYKSVASEVGGESVEYPLHVNGSSYSFDAREIIAQVQSKKPRLMLCASPNNPTGNSLGLNDLHLILEECKGTLIVIDEAYAGFTDGSASETVPLLVRKHNNLAVLRTFSKLYALAGIRIGYGFAGSAFGKLAAYSKRYLGYNQLSEKLALAALRDKAYYESVRRRVSDERERLYLFFQAINGATVYRSDANFLLVRLPVNTAATLKEHLTAAGIALKFFDEQEFAGHVRITIGTPDQNSALLGQLRKYFSDLHLISQQH